MAEGLLHTIGTGQRTPVEFIRLLKNHGIQRVLDVRRFPKSRFCHFRQENLALMLEKAEMEYRWLGKELGGYRDGGYGAYMKSQDFQQGLKALIKLAREKCSLILCAEKLPSWLLKIISPGSRLLAVAASLSQNQLRRAAIDNP